MLCDGRLLTDVVPLLHDALVAIEKASGAGVEGRTLRPLPLPPVALRDEVFQPFGGDANPSVPQPCAFCAGVAFATETDLRTHTNDRHGGWDRYLRLLSRNPLNQITPEWATFAVYRFPSVSSPLPVLPCFPSKDYPPSEVPPPRLQFPGAGQDSRLAVPHKEYNAAVSLRNDCLQ